MDQLIQKCKDLAREDADCYGGTYAYEFNALVIKGDTYNEGQAGQKLDELDLFEGE